MHSGKFLIYEAGAIKGLRIDQYLTWRTVLKHDLEEYSWKTVVFNPATKYSYDAPKDYDSEMEIQRYEMNYLRKSDLVIVNLQNKADSIGTSCELAVANELRIPIVALVDDTELHPWIENMIWKKFTNLNSLEEYVRDYFLSVL